MTTTDIGLASVLVCIGFNCTITPTIRRGRNAFAFEDVALNLNGQDFTPESISKLYFDHALTLDARRLLEARNRLFYEASGRTVKAVTA